LEDKLHTNEWIVHYYKKVFISGSKRPSEMTLEPLLLYRC
jgi:hypothetical protein